MKSLMIAAVLGFVMASAAACGSDTGETGAGGSTSEHGGDCTSLCEEAQSRDCTSIHGDCGAFCSSLESVAQAGGCTSQYDGYESCLGDGDVCTGDSRCSSEKGALTDCATAYCVNHVSDGNCQLVASSL